MAKNIGSKSISLGLRSSLGIYFGMSPSLKMLDCLDLGSGYTNIDLNVSRLVSS